MISLRVTDPTGLETVLELLPGRLSAGSDELDAIRLPGAGPTELELEVTADAVVVAAFSETTLVGGRPMREGERRLLRPREPLTVAGYRLEVVGAALPVGEGTCAIARGMLAGALGEAAPPALPELLWLTGPDLGRRLPLLDASIVFGRGLGAAARVRDALASRRHARLDLEGGRARLHDLGSANGVYVDGERIVGVRELRGGEVLRIGDTEIGFEATLEAAPEPPSTPPRPAEPLRPLPVRDRRVRRLTGLELAVISLAASASALGLVATWLLAR